MATQSTGVVNKTERYSYISFPVDRRGRRVEVTLYERGQPAWSTIANDPYNKIVADGDSYTLVAKLVNVALFNDPFQRPPLGFFQSGVAPVESTVFIDNTDANIPEIFVFIYS